MKCLTRAHVGPLLFSFSAALLAGCQGIKPVPAPAAMVLPVCINDECAVLDQNGVVQVSADNDYDAVYDGPMNSTLLFARDGLWNLASGDGKQVIKAEFTNELWTLTPGYFGFKRNGKFGVMDAQGKEIQPATYDEVFEGDFNEFIVYEVDGKRGFLSATGQKLSDPVFDSSRVRGKFAELGNWITGERDGEPWALNITTGELKKVEFEEIDAGAGQVMVVSNGRGEAKGLATANATLVTELKYEWIGKPGVGLVAFKEAGAKLCGYMDFKGKTVIAPTFAECKPFGKKSAGVMAANVEGKNKGGFIGRDGKWLIEPTYASVGDVDLSFMGMLGNVPGYSHVGVLQNMFLAYYGVFDLNKGVEVLKPEYLQVGVLTDNLFAFSDLASPYRTIKIFGQPNQVRAVGVVDAKGKVLIKPDEFTYFQMDASGRYLSAYEALGAPARVALYDLDGKQVVPARWQELVVDVARGAIFGYEVQGTGDDASRSLRALYRLDGTPVFDTTLVKAGCDVEQVRNGKGEVLWPTDPQAYCEAPDDEA